MFLALSKRSPVNNPPRTWIVKTSDLEGGSTNAKPMENQERQRKRRTEWTTDRRRRGATESRRQRLRIDRDPRRNKRSQPAGEIPAVRLPRVDLEHGTPEF